MKRVLYAVLIVMPALVGLAFAQEPVYPTDLRADSIAYHVTPDTYEMEITAYFTVYSSHASWAQYWQYVSIYLGGKEICCYPAFYFETQGNSCGVDLDCNDQCQMAVYDWSAEEAPFVWKHCGTWHTWYGTGCDPFDPTHTCQPLDICACGAQYTVTLNTIYNGETEIRLVLDNTYDYGGAGMTEEADETNNSLTVFIGSVGVSPKSWGVIKSLF
jgi:hypothetical protein